MSKGRCWNSCCVDDRRAGRTTARGAGKAWDLRTLTEEAHRRREVREVEEAHGEGRKPGFRGRKKRLCMFPNHRVPAVLGSSRGMHTVRTVIY